MKKLYRSGKDSKIAGICGGMGEYFNVDPTLVRLLFVFLFIVTGFVPMGVMYLVSWWVIPISPEQ